MTKKISKIKLIFKEKPIELKQPRNIYDEEDQNRQLLDIDVKNPFNRDIRDFNKFNFTDFSKEAADINVYKAA